MQGKSEPLGDERVDASHLISSKPAQATVPICTLEVKPGEQPRCVLGDYDPSARLKGFTDKHTPDPEPKNSVVTQITNITIAKKQRLHLHVANYGSKTVTAIVREL